MSRLKDLHEKRMELRDRISELNREKKTLDEQLRETEEQILELIQGLGVDHFTMGGYRYKPEDMVRPTVTDWDALYVWILEHKAPFLLQRRVNATNWQDLEESGEHVPGIEPVQMTRLKVVKAV